MPGVDLNDTAALEEMDDLDASDRAAVILPDVNVLIYAFRSDTPHHALCRQWLE